MRRGGTQPLDNELLETKRKQDPTETITFSKDFVGFASRGQGDTHM